MAERFIVTGGAGFIGSNVVAALNGRGCDDILVVDNLDGGLKQRNLDDLSYAAFMDKREFRAAFNGGTVEAPDAVFHLGACSSTTETDRDYLLDNNYHYTRELCQWCLERGARFIYASSAATYGDGARGYSDEHGLVPSLEPLNLYGESKQLFDRWALENGLLDRIAGLKYFNVYGPREDHKGDMRSLVNKAYGQILETGALNLFRSHRPDYADGEQERDFVYVRDAVNVTLHFYDHPEVSGLFNCGTGTARTWVDLAGALFAAMGRAPNILFVDMPPAIRDKYQYHTEADITRLRAAGYAAPFMSIEAGVKDYVRTWLEPARSGLAPS
jgi:ADP-L-glycero-D-manno-heptose 6-epimerase